MRPKVREIDPGGGPGEDVEEIVATAPAGGGGDAAGAGAGDRAGPRVETRDAAVIEDVPDHAPPTAADLGPNGEEVLGLIRRAGALTGTQVHALEEESGWRWWMLSPLVGTTMPAARARALILGRRDGRADAIVAMDAAIHEVLLHGDGTKAHGSRLLTCVTNAGLAVLVRDLIEAEVFETLHGPWGAVMHG
jgi:hypothetical protein